MKEFHICKFKLNIREPEVPKDYEKSVGRMKYAHE